jgi:hypothetical protein
MVVLYCNVSEYFSAVYYALCNSFNSMTLKSLASLMKCQRMNALLGDVMAGLEKISASRRSNPMFVADIPLQRLCSHLMRLLQE